MSTAYPHLPLPRPSTPAEEDAVLDEMGWVASRAVQLAGHGGPDEWIEFFDRKANLLERLGHPDLAAAARAQAMRYRTGELP